MLDHRVLRLLHTHMGLSFFKMSSGDVIRVAAPLRGKIARVDVNSCACVSGCQGWEERGNF